LPVLTIPAFTQLACQTRAAWSVAIGHVAAGSMNDVV